MKKVKLAILAAIVVASVGTGLAFKTNSGTLFCGTTSSSCPDQKVNQFVLDPGNPNPDAFCTSQQGSTNCVEAINE
jgi:hypothetical protein